MLGLRYISWGDNTGYAVAAKSYIRALVDHGTNLTWTPMLTREGPYEVAPAASWDRLRLDAVSNRPIEYDTVLIHTVPEYYPDWIDAERAQGRRVFGYTVWELEQLPDHWPAILNRLDGVIVPCHWNADVFRGSGVSVPIHVVPHLSQFEGAVAVSPADQAALEARLGGQDALRDRFIFYTIGFWSNRKAPYLAARAYWQAFSADDPVLMVVKTSAKDITRWTRQWRSAFRLRHPAPNEALAKLAAEYRNPAPLVVIADETLSDAEMLALHQKGDCFVSLTRTEGWGLGAFEAARLGKPVVMTGYGGQLDFLDRDLAYIVDFTMIPVHEPTWSANYRSSDRWAEPSMAGATQALRAIFEDRQAAGERARQLAGHIGQKFSRQAVMDALLRALS